MSPDEIIVVGKTFEDTTLEDGSQQVIEKTRYKRLIDGYIWTVSNVIQLNDIEDVMQNTGVEDELDNKHAPTWSMSYSGSESASTVDAAELDVALSTSPDGDQEVARAGRQMYHRSMNADHPTSTPKYKKVGWRGQLFSPAFSIDEESSLHLDDMPNHKRTIFASSPDRRNKSENGDMNNHRKSGSVANTDKRRLERKRRCMFLFLYACFITAGVVVAALMLRLWFKYYPSANESPENVGLSDEIIDTTDSDMLELDARQFETGNTGDVDVVKEEDVSDMASVADEANTLSTTANAEEVVVPCIHLKVTTKADVSTDITSWKLTRVGEDGSIITIGEANYLAFDDSNTFEECVDPGVYTFHISDSGGDGLGERGKTGYIINADGIDFGVSTWFLHEEQMTFSLPLVANIGFCSDDFLLVVKTDDKPEETRWDVVDNDSGETVLRGGPYSLPQSIHTQRACLSDGNYTFNMHDLGGEGICCDNGKGFFSLYKNGAEVVDSNGQFGTKNSKVFVLSSP